MNKLKPILASSALSGALVLGILACDRKPSEATVQAQAAAKAADDRVALLEKEMADLKGGAQATQAAQAVDKETAAQVTQAQMQSLSRQLEGTRRRAEERRRSAGTSAEAAPGQGRGMVMVVPAETQVSVKLNADLATDTNQPGDSWEGVLGEAVSAGGMVVWPAGTPVQGVVAQSTPAGRLASGKGALAIKLTTVGRNEVSAGTYLMVGDARGQRDAKYIGGTAALGALIGILSDRSNRGDHALGGAAAGAVAGTALAAGTASTTIRIPVSHLVIFTLTAPESVVMR